MIVCYFWMIGTEVNGSHMWTFLVEIDRLELVAPPFPVRVPC